jgi:rhodanese-related sulfurtransferase
MAIGELAPAELQRRLAAGDDLVVVDVREAEELAICALEGAVHLPLSELSVRHTELDPDRPAVLVCHHGIRSAHACLALEHLGFDTLYNLAGGIDRWAVEVDTGMARY